MLCQVAGIVILDNDGNRIAAKYTATNTSDSAVLGNFAQQRAFEEKLCSKVNRLSGRNEVEVITLDTYCVLYKATNDVNLLVIGGDGEENELILSDVVNALYNTLYYITNGHVNKGQLYENLGSVFLVLDEMIEQGLIFETDSSVIASRIQMSEKPVKENVEQTAFNHAFNNAKENLLRSFLAS